MVMGTVEFAGAEFGLTPCIVISAAVIVLVTVGGAVVGDAGATVFVGGTVGEMGVGVTVGVMGVAEGGIVGVIVSVGVIVTGVSVGRGVSELMGVGEGVMKIGAPNSLHPKSGAAPV